MSDALDATYAREVGPSADQSWYAESCVAGIAHLERSSVDQPLISMLQLDKLTIIQESVDKDKTPDGNVDEVVIQQPVEDSRSEQVKQRREQILAEAHTEEQRKQIGELLRKLEQSQHSDKEISDTYQQVLRLLKGRENAHVPEQQVQELAIDILRHAADPHGSVNQGGTLTCGPTVAAERLFSVDPSKAAEMITSAVLAGSWTAPDGTVIKLNDLDLKPYSGLPKSDNSDDQRTHALKIFELVFLNSLGQTGRFNNGEKLYYHQNNSGIDGGYFSDNPNPGPPTPGHPHIPLLSQEIAGSENFLRDIQALVQGISDDNRKFVVALDQWPHFPGAMTVKTEADLTNLLTRAQTDQNMPLVIVVRGGSHVLSVSGYDPETGMANVSNQWGSQFDGRIPVKKLFEWMGTPGISLLPNE